MTEKAKPKVDTVRLQNMSRAFIESASMFAAIDLELFTAVENSKTQIKPQSLAATKQ
ncbi:hypothetical protein N8214_02640 [Pseudomonadales bacterium]|nr:hypothetical protein [Pseudomonadales bacterium]